MTDRFNTILAAAWLGVLFAAATHASANEPTPEQLEFFENKIRPVLAQHCYTIEDEKIEADMENGVLSVHIPKQPEPAKEQIPERAIKIK